MAIDPVTGPVPKDEFKKLVDLPHGKAIKEIRKYDPQWGLKEGEKIEWRVEVSRDACDKGVAYVQASSQQEADELADELKASDVDWHWNDDSIVIDSVKPSKAK